MVVGWHCKLPLLCGLLVCVPGAPWCTEFYQGRLQLFVFICKSSVETQEESAGVGSYFLTRVSAPITVAFLGASLVCSWDGCDMQLCPLTQESALDETRSLVALDSHLSPRLGPSGMALSPSVPSGMAQFAWQGLTLFRW